MDVKGKIVGIKKTYDKMTPGKKMMVAAQAGLLFVAAAGGAVLSQKILANAASVDGEIEQFRGAAKEALLAGKTTLVFMNRDIELVKEHGSACSYTAYAIQGLDRVQITEPPTVRDPEMPFYITDPTPPCTPSASVKPAAATAG